MTTTNAVDKIKIPGLFILIAFLLFNLMSVPVYAAWELEYPHWDGNYIDCGSCHTRFLKFGEYTPLNIDDTKPNNTCWSCHNDTDAMYVATHSSLQTDTRYGDWTVQCVVCHSQHGQSQIRSWPSATYLYLYKGNSTGITTTTLTMTGASWSDDAYAGLVITPNKAQRGYSYKIVTNTTDTLTVQGPIDLTYVNSGDTFVITYGKLIKSFINNQKSTEPILVRRGNKKVRFFNATGPNSFADGDATYDGICEICHTMTTHFRNDGSGSDQYHDNIGGAEGTKCTTCHNHRNGFAHGDGGGAGCEECHGHDTDYGDVTGGKGTYQSHSTHTENDADDAKGPNLACSACHDTNNFPAFADGQASLAATTVCDTCHSPEGTYDGLNDPTVGAKTIWHTGAYVATDDSTLATGREKWCATCHDEVPSVIQAIAAPNVVGDEDGSYTYGTGWGYYKTGHGVPAGEAYPYKGGLIDPPLVNGASRVVNCDGCHDFSTAHIDGAARSFNDGDSSTLDPGNYRQCYRLQQVNFGEGSGASSKEPLLVPRPQHTGNPSLHSRLCFNCHDSVPFTEDDNPNTNLETDQDSNLHQYHMGLDQIRYASDWNGVNNSMITCMSCHNVHGSTRLAMVRDGKLINREPGLMIWYNNDAVVSYNTGNTDPPVPEDLPLAASTGTVWRGATSVNLCSHCHGNNNTIPEYRTPYQDITQGSTLTWTGETNYVTDGANPDSAVTSSSFTFRVQYTNTNNDAPTTIQVWVDDDNDGYEESEKHDLTAVDGDTAYYDGKLYSTSLDLTNSNGNNKPYRFYAVSGSEATGSATSGSSIYVLDSGSGSGDAPVLGWTGETNFTTEGVNPDSGASGSSFEFRVKYTDSENDPPALMQLWIDEDADGAYNSTEKYAIAEDGGGADYTEGRFFSKSLILSCAGGCSFDYRFYATDGNSEATGPPVSNGTVTVLNNVPALDWTGQANYVSDGVDPDSGDGGSNFTFQVEYSDTDNSEPNIIQVWVDSDDSGAYDAYEKFDLTWESGDGDYRNGEFYSTVEAIPYVDDGSITYRFYASDGANPATTGAPLSDSVLTITAPSGNNTPSLSWASTNCLKGGVRPGTGAEGADFEFKVIYTDSDTGQCAADILLLIDEDDDGSYAPEEKYLLTGDDLDTDCTDGRLYETTLNLVVAGDGDLNYRFYATDSIDAATGTPATDSTVTVIGAFKVRPSGGDGWYSTIQDAINASTDPSTILVYPNSDFSATTYNENISLINFLDNRTIQSTCGADLTTINSATGTHTVIFQDSNNPVLVGFTITGATLDANRAGIYVNRDNDGSGTDFILRNNKIHGNSQGIIINDSNGTPVKIQNSQIYNNTSRGLYAGADVVFELTDSEIYGHNTTVAGAAINLNGTSSTTIKRSTIRDNITTGEAGAMYINGDATKTTTIENTVFADNQGSNGGAIRTNSGPTVSIVNTTFADNTATGSGGVFYICSTGSTTVRNSIFWGNSATTSGDVAYKACSGFYNDFMTITDSDVDTSASDFGNGTATTSNNIDPAEDPLFEDAAADDYHIQSGSPVIDQASSGYAPDDDIDGQARPQGASDDMGADEYLSAPVASTTAGTATAIVAGDTSIDISMPYTDDNNSNNTYTVDYKLHSEPTVWTNLVTEAANTASPYATTISALTADETYDVRMTYNDAADGVTGTAQQTVYNIDLTLYVDLTAASQTVAENVGTVTVTATLSRINGSEVAVPFTVSGTATAGGTDHNLTDGNITVTAGQLTGTTNFTVTDDSLDEADETVIVTMGTPVNATTGPVDVHTVTITDNDAAPSVTFTSAAQSTADESGQATITAQLSAVSSLDVTVPFTVNGSSTATGGDTDYSITAGPVTITAGNTTADITITVTTDSLDEDDETVIVDMGSPTNATQGATATHTATITDDDAAPSVSFTSASQSTADESGTAIITAQLSAVSSRDVTLPFTVNGSSTATSGGTDYSITASPITITAGNTTADITVTIATDSDVEDDETVIVDMASPTNATQGLTTTHTLSITDDDSGGGLNVTKTSDTNDGTCDADCSLREAITAANAAADIDTINVPAGTYTITLSGSDDTNAAGDFDITNPVTIIGAGSGLTIIRAASDLPSAADRIFHVTNSSAVTIEAVKVQFGKITVDGGCIYAASDITIKDSIIDSCTSTANLRYGGAIYSGGALTMENSTVSNGTAAHFGGAIHTYGGTLTNVTFTNNHVLNAHGGAIYNSTNLLTINGSANTFTGNYADTTSTDYGGAIYSTGSLTISNTSFTGRSGTNDAGRGGAIYLLDTTDVLTLSDSSFTDVGATNSGGAIRMNGGTMSNVTFTDNQAELSHGGAIENFTNLLTITGTNTFDGNRAGTGSTDYGGSIYSTGSLTISNTTFTGRDDGVVDAGRGGVISLFDTTNVLTLSDSSFSNSLTTNSGGAIRMYGGTMSNVTFTDNQAQLSVGGAIENFTNPLTITGTNTFTNNVAGTGSGDNGGMIYTTGSLTLSNTTASGNIAYEGGAIYIANGVALTVTDSSFDANQALRIGGAIRSGTGGITISSSTFSNNSTTNPALAHDGGAIYSSGILNVTNSTFFANTVGDDGGAIYQTTDATIKNSTFYNNSAVGSGEAIYRSGGTVTLENTIVAKSTASSSLCTNVTSNDYNLQYNGTCFTAQANDLSADPLLNALADNGGPTLTHSLQPSSPAIDSGNNATCAAAPMNNLDQRGESRPIDGDGDTNADCDIGAYEY